MLPRVIFGVVLAIVLGACSRGETVECPGDTNYLAAASAESLRVPDDLSVPDEADALRIPGPMPGPEPDDARCLQYSPAFAGGQEE